MTARELCHYFFVPEVRMEWETTLEQATVLEKIAEDTLVFLQLHKRVWPAAQRDALFWSHSRCIKSENHSQTWIVCNQVHMYVHISVVSTNSNMFTRFEVRFGENFSKQRRF